MQNQHIIAIVFFMPIMNSQKKKQGKSHTQSPYRVIMTWHKANRGGRRPLQWTCKTLEKEAEEDKDGKTPVFMD